MLPPAITKYLLICTKADEHVPSRDEGRIVPPSFGQCNVCRTAFAVAHLLVFSSSSSSVPSLSLLHPSLFLVPCSLSIDFLWLHSFKSYFPFAQPAKLSLQRCSFPALPFSWPFSWWGPWPTVSFPGCCFVYVALDADTCLTRRGHLRAIPPVGSSCCPWS